MSPHPEFPSASPKELVRYFAMRYREAAAKARACESPEEVSLWREIACAAFYNAVLWRHSRNAGASVALHLTPTRFRRDLDS